MKKKWVSPTDVYIQGVQKQLPEYGQWNSMRKRCLVGGAIQLRSPSYIGVTLAEEWKSYDAWLDWASTQIGFLSVDEKGNLFQLDKDLISDSRVYSKETCVFIPRVINSFLTSATGIRGKYPVGVSYYPKYNNYTAKISNGQGITRFIGYYPTPELAFQAYKSVKEQQAIDLATKWRSQIDPRAYQALLDFKADNL